MLLLIAVFASPFSLYAITHPVPYLYSRALPLLPCPCLSYSAPMLPTLLIPLLRLHLPSPISPLLKTHTPSSPLSFSPLSSSPPPLVFCLSYSPFSICIFFFPPTSLSLLSSLHLCSPFPSFSLLLLSSPLLSSHSPPLLFLPLLSSSYLSSVYLSS
jgi:hypothetical protein